MLFTLDLLELSQIFANIFFVIWKTKVPQEIRMSPMYTSVLYSVPYEIGMAVSWIGDLLFLRFREHNNLLLLLSHSPPPPPFFSYSCIVILHACTWLYSWLATWLFHTLPMEVTSSRAILAIARSAGQKCASFFTSPYLLHIRFWLD